MIAEIRIYNLEEFEQMPLLSRRPLRFKIKISEHIAKSKQKSNVNIT